MSSQASQATIGAGRFSGPPQNQGKTWFIGPKLDLLVMANLVWPLIALGVWWTWTFPVHRQIDFLQAYFFVTPHRWVTLVLVFLDRDRFEKWTFPFVGLAVVFTGLCGFAYWQFGIQGFVVMVGIDYLWNAWHFASQHAGIYRIYGRISRPDRDGGGELEKLLIRTFAFYIFFRMVGVLALPSFTHPSFAWLKVLSKSDFLQWVDFAILLLPWFLLVRDLKDYRPSMKGRVIYLASFSILYSLILLGVRARSAGVQGLETGILALFFTLALFHATEYMTIVSWTATRNKSPRGLIKHLIPRWLFFLACFMGVLGVTAWVFKESTFSKTHNLLPLWLWINLVVSLLHYAYDGIIWRSPKKAKAAT